MLAAQPLRDRDRAGGAAATAATFLTLAAAPTFAGMGLLTVAVGNIRPEWLCVAGPVASPLSDMAAMYLLMSVFHAAPWLRLLMRRHGRS